MSPATQTARKKPSPKKLTNSKQAAASIHDAPKKPTIRHSFESAPNLGEDIYLIFVGSPAKLFPTHSALFPPRALTILNNSIYQPNPEVPIWFHTINAMTETFEIYRNWLYTEKSKLFCHDAEGDQDFADDGSGPAHEGREWIRLALAYLLGLKFGDEGFCNAVIDGLVEKMGESQRYPTGLANEVYSHTVHGDRLRALLVDLRVWKGHGTGIDPPYEDADGPVYFRRDVRREVKEAGTALTDPNVCMPWEIDQCQYHTHDTTARCTSAETEEPPIQIGGVGKSAAPTPPLPQTTGMQPRRSPRSVRVDVPNTIKRVCKPQASKRR